MITLFLILLLLSFIFWIGLKITGITLIALIWLCVKIPVGIFLFSIGLALCCTIILIPVGAGMIKAGCSLIIPG